MDYPPFADALERLRHFLRCCEAPHFIRWVAFLDVAFVNGRIYLWPRSDELATAAAESKYAAASERRLGVQLAGLCQLNTVSYCYVYRPSNRIEAERTMMPDGLKLLVPHPLPTGILIENKEEWKRIRSQDRNLH